MEVDTGASDVSLVSEATWKELQGVNWRASLNQTSVRLHACAPIQERTYQCWAKHCVAVQSGAQAAQLPILVVAGNGPSLLGRNWLAQLRLNWKEIHHTSGRINLQDSSRQAHTAVFSSQLGKIVGVKAKLYVKKDVRPVFLQSYI